MGNQTHVGMGRDAGAVIGTLLALAVLALIPKYRRTKATKPHSSSVALESEALLNDGKVNFGYCSKAIFNSSKIGYPSSPVTTHQTFDRVKATNASFRLCVSVSFFHFKG